MRGSPDVSRRFEEASSELGLQLVSVSMCLMAFAREKFRHGDGLAARGLPGARIRRPAKGLLLPARSGLLPVPHGCPVPSAPQSPMGSAEQSDTRPELWVPQILKDHLESVPEGRPSASQ